MMSRQKHQEQQYRQHRVFCILLVLICNLASCCLGAVVFNGLDDDVEVFKKKSDFEKRVVKGGGDGGIWLVQFYTPSCKDCEKFASQYRALASTFRGLAHVAAVNAEDENEKEIAMAYGGGGAFPSFKLFGEDKMTPRDFTGSVNVQSLMDFIVKEMQSTIQSRASKNFGNTNFNQQNQQQQQQQQRSSSSSGKRGKSAVVELNESNFEEKVLKNLEVGLVAFVAPWCGHCKALLPEWESAASNLAGQGVYLGVVDATAESQLAASFAIKGYPTIKLFPGGNPNKTYATATDYEGPRTESQIVQFALAEVDRSGVPKEIPQLTDRSILQTECVDNNNRICVLVALPHILDSMASGRNKYKDLIAKVAKTFRGSAFTFLWFEGGSSQYELEQALDLTFGFPAVAAISFDKGVYAVQRGSFAEKNIGLFLTSITTGRQPTTKLSITTQMLLDKIQSVDPWDGLDGVPFEEESLDDIMGWDDDDEKDL